MLSLNWHGMKAAIIMYARIADIFRRVQHSFRTKWRTSQMSKSYRRGWLVSLKVKMLFSYCAPRRECKHFTRNGTLFFYRTK